MPSLDLGEQEAKNKKTKTNKRKQNKTKKKTKQNKTKKKSNPKQDKTKNRKWDKNQNKTRKNKAEITAKNRSRFFHAPGQAAAFILIQGYILYFLLLSDGHSSCSSLPFLQ